MAKELAMLFGCMGCRSMVALRDHKGRVGEASCRHRFRHISRHTRGSDDMQRSAKSRTSCFGAMG